MGSMATRKVGRSPALKMKLVKESWGLSGEKLGVFLRSRGVHSIELQEWRRQMSEGLEGNVILNVGTKSEYKKKIEKLEKEIAELKAVVVAQKKVRKILADEEKSTLKESVKPSSKSSKKR